jgi:predicted phage-related endonuclease
VVSNLSIENEIGIIGDRVITWKTVNQERIDSKSLKAEQPALYKQYANLSSHRRFSVKAAS